MKKVILSAALAIAGTTTCLFAQTNILSTNTLAEQIMLGNYNPASFQASVVINKPADISQGITNRVSPDSLYSYLDVLQTFGNRNTGSDTVSATRGIGAARRWVYSKLEQFSSENENRLIPSYLQFDQSICSIDQHRNVFAVIPGADITDKSVVILEAHLDSRCEGLCDTSCVAEGMEDNASGTALVLELARVMSKYTYNHTLVFILTTSEEQGLNGARAFAKYCKDKGIKVRAVLNNDVVGGIICGQTASSPGCMGAGTIDSTNLRLFSGGTFNSPHKQLARFVKLEYKEQLLPIAKVPMTINIMSPLDRNGRGGDHIPFYDEQYTAIRFCAANEHGDADVSNPNYSDRQHSTRDLFGVDTDNDNKIDSFFIDFNYLARMSVINGNAAAMAASGPKTPEFDVVVTPGDEAISVFINTEKQYQHYRVGIRTSTNDWDTVATILNSDHIYIPLHGGLKTQFVSVASVDAEGVESLFSEEKVAMLNITDLTKNKQLPVELLQNHPNPFDGETTISVLANESIMDVNAYISVTDIAGKEIKRMKITLNKGVNEVTYEHGYHVVGNYVYTLVINGEKIQSRRMVFAN
ncbi:MAG: M20/M25/M40 family metallo-hydrolase [Chitinophagaceae bacterium]|nr:M20/M25/M40 family metallo-hydrolase [Chitinophagaceae bacterium]MCB9045657.1 M20/M25/M40 family metallo-hydrolase [Chitinophagales bacterium]